jgi:hypothetical protein
MEFVQFALLAPHPLIKACAGIYSKPPIDSHITSLKRRFSVREHVNS